ncbi:hypothetical protein XBKB1_1800002 [Xenorhabdus bovienii str. kraussei Becker Underwood]|uniref:Bacteriophage protein n=1 Tax=Xenorhabdus bovienii str. kraussei Becker Underwood TaxID=1398204 RepID=A0A077PUF9_XENBV|nr:hypothetical protein XBKB1_1800002 [Xenorhabdus bovienii str. kraussei Becker Underwood]
MSVVKAILDLSEMLGQLVYRGDKGIQDLIGWWKKLDEGSKDLIKTFGLILAAWWALNAGFLTSPIGIITALAAALFLLYDDYKTWKEGGKSLIDWSKWEGTIEKVGENIKQLKDWILNIKDVVGGWENIFWGFALFFAGKWLTSILGTLGKLSGAIGKSGLTKLLRTAGLLVYGEYLYSDWDNIAASAKASWNSNTRDLQRTLGDVGQALGMENKWASQHKGYQFTETTIDIPTGDPYLDQLRLKVIRGEMTREEANKILDKQLASASSNQTSGNSRGERNNNPLNMEYAKQRGATVEDHPEQRFAKFGTAYEGLERTAWQLRRYFNGLTDKVQRQSVDLIVSKWAPPGKKDNNRTEAYIQRVAKRLGVGRHDRLDLNDDNVIYALMNAMSQEEIGKPLPYDKNVIMSAIAGAPNPTKALAKNSSFNFDPKMFDNALPNINNMLSHTGYTPKRLELLANNQPNQTTIAPYYNINVNGVDSPHEAAALTGESVQRANAILVRSLQTKVS